MNNYKNWEQILLEFKKAEESGRKDFDVFLKWLSESDFKTAPASTKFHNSVDGGLMDHSLNVLKFARLLNSELKLNIDDTSIILSSLLHDLCKVNFYTMGWEWDKEVKDKTGKWEKKDVYKVEDQFPMGHGEKSVIVALQQGLVLKEEEMAAIRWHMLKWDVSESSKYTMSDAMDKIPLVKIIALADQMAELYETQNAQRDS